MTVKELNKILQKHDDESLVTIELLNRGGGFVAFPVVGESGISVYGPGGMLVLEIEAFAGEENPPEEERKWHASPRQ